MRTALTVAAFLISLTSCQRCSPSTSSIDAQSTADAGSLQLPSQVAIKNATDKDTIAYFAFGADSVVLPSAWSFCAATSNLNCSFKLKAGEEKVLPTPSGAELGVQNNGYLNVTVSFGAAVTCNVTKAELNLNNPSWYNIVDVSLVDGYSNDVLIKYQDAGNNVTLGPVLSKTGNEKALGVYPYGCDICVARQNPPCGISKGRDGCKAGTQYNPDVPCQYQGATKGGGANVLVALVKPEPAGR